MKNRVTRHILFILLGIVLIAAGILIISEELKAVTGVCIGIGGALISTSAVNLLIHRYYSKNPALKRQGDIDAKDERNIAIANKAKAKAFDILIKILIVIPFLLILGDLPLWLILSTVVLYLLGFGLQIYFTKRYSEVM